MKISRTRLKEIIKGVMTEENEYQAFFQTALDKAGKSIPSMSDEEKKAFFDKIDAAWNGKGEKNEELVGGQKKLDVDKDGDIGSDDLADLRAGKKTNESVNFYSGPLELKGIKINKKSPVTFVLEVSFLIGDEVVISYLTTGTSQDAQKLKSKVEKAFSSGKIVSPSGIGYYAYNESVNEDYDGPAILKTGDKNALKVGEKITINSGGKKKEYKVVKSNGNGDFVLHIVESVKKK
jgi:uncharacterized protein involved in tolerance to divalent cations